MTAIAQKENQSPRGRRPAGDYHAPAAPALASPGQEQLQALVQQLFLRDDMPPVKTLGFVGADRETDTAQLIFRVGELLAGDYGGCIGLIDASEALPPLSAALGLPPGDGGEAGGLAMPRGLECVPLQGWISGTASRALADRDTNRLRQVSRQFDFSLCRCNAGSWLTAVAARACDGLILALTANTTRRAVALQVRDQLLSTGIQLMGTVLLQRRFPVPQSLYRRL